MLQNLSEPQLARRAEIPSKLIIKGGCEYATCYSNTGIFSAYTVNKQDFTPPVHHIHNALQHLEGQQTSATSAELIFSVHKIQLHTFAARRGSGVKSQEGIATKGLMQH